MVSKSYLKSTLVHDELEYLREELEETEYLIEAGRHTFAKSKQTDLTELITASTRGDRKQVQLLLEMGADFNMRDSVSYMHVHTREIYIHTL